MASEPEGPNRDYFVPYNKFDTVPSDLVQLSESSSSSDEDEEPKDEVTVLWRVTPDYGELDDNVLDRNSSSFKWVNPLSLHDDGNDDDQVVL